MHCAEDYASPTMGHYGPWVSQPYRDISNREVGWVCSDVDVTDDYSQQSIGDCVTLSGDVFYGCGIITNVGQMSLLASRPGEGEWLLVGAYHKIVGFQ